MTITYDTSATVDPSELIDLLQGGGFKRPLSDLERVQLMLDNADVLIAAREDGKLVGCVRGLTDFTFYALVAELVVAPDHKGHGIGRELLSRFRQEVSERCNIVLVSSEEGDAFYEHLGWERVPRGWRLPRIT